MDLTKYGTDLITYIKTSTEEAARAEVRKQMWMIAGVAALAGIAAVIVTKAVK